MGNNNHPGIYLFTIIISILPFHLFSQRGLDDSYLDQIVNEENYLPLYSEKNDEIVDLVVMPYGGESRLSYTKEQLIPYLFRYNRNGELEWLFDGFLFYEDRTDLGDGHAFEQHAYLFQKDRARKSEWEWLLDRIFTSGKSLSALNELIQETVVREEIMPSRKRKIILSIPEPLSGQLDWGDLNGKVLDFANDSDRVEAVRWYIDQLVDRFQAARYEHLELSGFYWLRPNDELSFQLMPIIASYIKSQGYKFYWRPSYGRFRGNNWKSYNFDAVYLTPDHLTTSWFKKINVERACTYASLYNMGLEVDLDNLVKRYALYREKFTDYMEVYSEQNVFTKAAMSYKDGDGIIYEMSQSSNSALNDIYNQVIDSVAARQIRADKYYLNMKK